ncbi:MAG: hypothetical protein JWP04_4187 [Belnapia sp.]|nr:hypothetical protein [Belnapia sp.]
MTDFVIVVATMAAVAGAGGAVPDRLPTLGFRTYPSLSDCEAAVGQNTPRPGTRLVCLPIEPPPGTMFSAH